LQLPLQAAAAVASGLGGSSLSLVESIEVVTPLNTVIIKLLEHYQIETGGKHCVVIGRSDIVGKPMSALMLQKNCTVTVCHSRTVDLAKYTLDADIVIAAIGSPKFLKANMIKEGAVVIDVGITRVEDANSKKGFKLLGDVDFEDLSEKASWITPVPGGVGPMTRVGLLLNTLDAVRINL
jgi:methylenetetrahydrofolate dehydrogenase (NADP+)/methenyltetrahydrofolate cyclohydrolase